MAWKYLRNRFCKAQGFASLRIFCGVRGTKWLPSLQTRISLYSCADHFVSVALTPTPLSSYDSWVAPSNFEHPMPPTPLALHVEFRSVQLSGQSHRVLKLLCRTRTL